MNVTNLTTVPPMPDLDCPAWCSADHYSNWRQHVEATQWVQQADPSRRIDPAPLLAGRGINERFVVANFRRGRRLATRDG